MPRIDMLLENLIDDISYAKRILLILEIEKDTK